MASSSSPLPLLISFISTVAVVTTTIATVASAAEFPVGGAVGWRIPAVNESQLYNVWASRRRFYTGDSLRFRYNNDSVVVVKKWGFYHCDSTKPIAYYNDGDTVINLETTGTMYFISGDADRCKEGVNMMVEVRSSGPVRYFPPTIANPPENGYAAVAPSPDSDRIMGSGGGSPAVSPGPSSESVVVVVWGLGFEFGFVGFISDELTPEMARLRLTTSEVTRRESRASRARGKDS